MNGPYLTFMLVPCGAAIATGWAVRHWTLAAAAVAGGLGIVFLLVAIASPLAKFLIPLGTAMAMSGLVLTPILLRRPSVSVWNRMMAALGLVFITHLAFLQFALAGQ